MSKQLMCLIILYCLFPPWTFAFDHKQTHPYLTEETVKNTKDFRNTLIIELGIGEAFEKKLNNGKDTYTITEWLQEGSKEEDEPKCRAANHFHNPLKTWDQAMLTDSIWLVDLRCEVTPYSTKYSNLVWATGFITPAQTPLTPPVNNDPDNKNNRNWFVARNLFYSALIEEDPQQREAFFAETFRTLGYVLHLLQDMAVPAHTRNDFSQGHSQIIGCPDEGDCDLFSLDWLGNPFEGYVRDRFDEIDAEISDISILFTGEKKLTNFWDTDTHVPDTKPTNFIGQDLGLAEYTNANFVSHATILKSESDTKHYFPFPNSDSIADQDYPDQVDEQIYNIIARDGKLDKGVYIAKNKHGEIIIKYLKPRYLFYGSGEFDLSYELEYTLDHQCYLEYAKRLIPRAIGYSAALLEYFFRGKMQVTSLPLLSDNAIYALRLNIKNITPSEETMSDGHFSVVIRYTPTGGNSDGSEDIFVRSYEIASETLQYDDEGVDVQLSFPEPVPVPMENYESVKCMLAFKGTLGNESGAVIGKSFTLGEIKFNEEWDNGLEGNHPWTLPTPDQNPDNGSTSNVIENDILIKDNIRFIGYDTARYNSSNLEVMDSDNPNGLLITPNTYLQFKIDDLSINEQPPAPEGSTNAWQFMSLEFNNGRGLEFSQEGQGVYWNSTTAYYTFGIGSTTVENIYSMFQNAGITIPEPLYLEHISISQQFTDLDEPSTVEHAQHMEIDYIRIIEKHEEPE